MRVLYYLGDLQYREIPAIFVEALEHGFDRYALRRLPQMVNPVKRDIRPQEIDLAFCEIGVNAPIPKDGARLVAAQPHHLDLSCRFQSSALA